MTTIDETSNKSAEYLRALTKTFTGIEKPLMNGTVVENLSDLIAKLHDVFNTDRVNIEDVNHLLLSYKSNPADWKKFAKFDRFRYTRNLVDAGNGKFNLMILCWGEGHGSAIHDHADAHCFMKMLKGELSEIRYAWPDNMNVNFPNDNSDISGTNDICDVDYDGSELQEISRCTLETNGVCYINDTLGLHRVENASHTNVAVSLHLYCPPFTSCSIFNKKTGKRTQCEEAAKTVVPEDN